MERSPFSLPSFSLMASDKQALDIRSETLLEKNRNLVCLVRVERETSTKKDKTIESLRNDIIRKELAINLTNRSIDSVCPLSLF